MIRLPQNNQKLTF